MSGIAVSVA